MGKIAVTIGNNRNIILSTNNTIAAIGLVRTNHKVDRNLAWSVYK